MGDHTSFPPTNFMIMDSTKGTPSPGLPPTVTSAVATTGDALNSEALAALIGGVAAGLLLALVTISAVLLWCMYRQKGSYDTNETKVQGPDWNEGPEEEEGSNTDLKSIQPLTTGEE